MRRLEKQSGSGVTIDGETTLEEFVAKQESDEMKTDIDAEIGKQKQSFYRDPPKGSYLGKGRSSFGRRWTREEINKKRWRETMNKTKADTVSVVQLVIGAMMDGAWLQPFQVRDRIQETTGRDLDRANVSWRMSSMYRSDGLGPFVERKKIGPRKFEYSFAHPIPVHLTADETYKLYLKSDKSVTPEILIEKYPDFGVYLDRSRKKFKEAVETKQPKVESVRTITPDIRSTIEEAVSSALGLEVSVSGKVEVVFRFVVGEPK